MARHPAIGTFRGAQQMTQTQQGQGRHRREGPHSTCRSLARNASTAAPPYDMPYHDRLGFPTDFALAIAECLRAQGPLHKGASTGGGAPPSCCAQLPYQSPAAAACPFEASETSQAPPGIPGHQLLGACTKTPTPKSLASWECATTRSQSPRQGHARLDCLEAAEECQCFQRTSSALPRHRRTSSCSALLRANVFSRDSQLGWGAPEPVVRCRKAGELYATSLVARGMDGGIGRSCTRPRRRTKQARSRTLDSVAIALDGAVRSRTRTLLDRPETQVD
jgi:hypothetical protein